MPAQETQHRTEQQQKTITLEQSLQTVKSLLIAGFGCITYLRGILPADNFTDGFMTAGTSSSQNTANRPSSQTSSVKLKAVKRGYSSEGDKLLDYLELGIFHALEKNYLKSFIFAVYLDPEDPNNIVECFTFNFTYHKVPGTDITVPLLTSLSDKMKKMTVGGAQKDDAQAAILSGKIPTLGEVKLSIKNLIRRFILLTQHMEHLPHRRFVTFKLFYVDETPADYEPPLFKAGDADKDRLFFTTHSVQEKPDKVSVGTIDTAFHGVSVEVTSITNLIPTAEDQLNSQPFGNVTTTAGAQQTLSELDKLALREREAMAQKEDAATRKVVWDAEGHVSSQGDLRDGEGSPDPEYMGETFDPTEETPIGIRDQEGRIVLVSSDAYDPNAMDIDGSLHGGSIVNDADYVQANKINDSYVGDPTQALVPAEPSLAAEYGTHGSFHPHANDPERADGSVISHGVDTAQLDYQMADSYEPSTNLGTLPGVTQIPETQQVDMSASQPKEQTSVLSELSVNVDRTSARRPRTRSMDSQLERCACDTNVVVDDDDELNDDWCECEGKCGLWYHLWCMGYDSIKVFQDYYPESTHSAKKWICFECRFLGDPRVDLLNDKEKEEKLLNFKSLALFRRTLKVISGKKGLPNGANQLKKKIGCEAATAGMLWKRLENEGFIAPEQDNVDAVGLLHTTAVNATTSKGKGKQKVRKNLKRPKYGLVHTKASEEAMKKYFDPKGGLEESLMGLKDIMRAVKQHTIQNKGEAASNKHVSPSIRIVPRLTLYTLTISFTPTSAPLLPPAYSQTSLVAEVAETQLSATRQLQLETQTQYVPNSLPHLPLSGSLRRRLEAGSQSEDWERPRKKLKVSLAEEGVDVEQ